MPNTQSSSQGENKTANHSLTKNLAFQTERLRRQYRLVYALLALVGVLNLSPLVFSIWRRLPDNIANNLSQITLLLSGSAASSVSFLVGKEDGRNNEESKSKEEQ